MADDGQQQSGGAPDPEVAKSLRGSGAWMAVQQGAQVVGEPGGGIGGIALAVQVAKQSKGGPSNQSSGGNGAAGGESKK
ncbi:MAG TPA: hypothetical protein VGL57_07970 [Solirubrobacteraceae bacterium]|jgi:hypothetical protein